MAYHLPTFPYLLVLLDEIHLAIFLLLDYAVIYAVHEEQVAIHLLVLGDDAKSCLCEVQYLSCRLWDQVAHFEKFQGISYLQLVGTRDLSGMLREVAYLLL
jgi:hypothetical protein